MEGSEKDPLTGSSCSRSCRGVCETCKPSKEFKKILSLKDSGLTIYVHNNKDKENQKPSPTDKKQDKIVLHNRTDKDLKRSDYIKELSKYKTQCFRCNTVLQQIHGLLDEVKEIRESEVRVVCQYCKAPNFTGQCSRCHYLVNKFVTTKVKEYDQRIQRFDEWLSKVKHILHAILEETNRARGKSTVQQDLASSDELKKLLLELETPLKITSRQPRIRQLLEIQSDSSAASIAESKKILETLLDIFKTVTKADFKREEEVRSASSTISLPPIKTVFKVLPKKSVESAFTLLPSSSEILPKQRSLFKGTVHPKQAQFVERDRDIDHARSQYPKRGRGADQYKDEDQYEDQGRYQKGDRSKEHKQYRDQYRYGDKYSGQNRGQEKGQTSGRIAKLQAKRDAEPSKELIKNKQLETKDKLQTEQGAKPAIEIAKGKGKNKSAEGLWPKEPLPEETSSKKLIKKAQLKRHTVEIAYKKQSLTQIEGFEIPKVVEESKIYLIKKPLFSVVVIKNKNEDPSQLTPSEDAIEVEKIGKKGNKKIKLAKDGKGKGKFKGKKKRARSNGSESDKSDISIPEISINVSDKENHKKSSLNISKKPGASTIKKSEDKEMRARSDESESDESDVSGKKNRKKSTSKRAHLKPNASTNLLRKLLKERDMEKRKEEKASKIERKDIRMPFIAKLPDVKYSKRPTFSEDLGTLAEAIVECESDMESSEMIKGTEIIQYDPYYKHRQPEGVVQPLLFRAQPVFRTLPEVKNPSLLTIPDQPTDTKHVNMNCFDMLDQSTELKGVLRYALSNRDFIENGCTLLPTVKLMRKENIYKMIPANPKYDWFERHKKRRLFYETGEKLAEVDEDGHGRWYYKNGILALDYYKAKEVNAGNRYVLYSSGQSDVFDEDQAQEPITVLACFDHIGNGVVYDQHGNVRIKYNQTEGIVMDKKIGPIARWKWHDLNDPPDVKQVFVDTYLEHPGVCLEKLQKEDSDKHLVRENSSGRLNIELDNFFKEKAHKILQKYKPFQIRMKALRINKEFSLKVIDQANIYLLFRSGQVSLKLNLGMVLISNEILDCDIVEATTILTPYDRVLPRSESVADIKRILNITRKRSQRRKDKFARNRFVSSDDSADQKSKSSCISRLLSSEC